MTRPPEKPPAVDERQDVAPGVTVDDTDRAVGMDPRIADDTDLGPSTPAAPPTGTAPVEADPMKSERAWVVAEWMKVAFLLGSLVLVVGLIGYKVYERQRYEEILIETIMDPLPVTMPSPQWTLTDGDGKNQTSLAQFKGRWVFVNLWATWCPPCREEMPSLEYLTRKLGKDIEFVAISVDEDWNEVRRFFGSDWPTFKLLWDPRRQVTRQYGTEKFPESYLVNPDGKVVAKFVGPRDWNNEASHEYFRGILGQKTR